MAKTEVLDFIQGLGFTRFQSMCIYDEEDIYLLHKEDYATEDDYFTEVSKRAKDWQDFQELMEEF